MAQFDLFEIEGGILVVDLQTDLIGLEATRLVAPLRPAESSADLRQLTPTVAFAGRSWRVRIPEAAALRASDLKHRVGSLAEARDQIKRAIDILIDGF